MTAQICVQILVVSGIVPPRGHGGEGGGGFSSTHFAKQAIPLQSQRLYCFGSFGGPTLFSVAFDHSTPSWKKKSFLANFVTFSEIVVERAFCCFQRKTWPNFGSVFP